MRRLASALLGLTLLLSATCGRPHELCSVCQREIHVGARTIAVDASGKEEAFCCPRCALTERASQGAAVSLQQVSDFQTGRLIAAQQALYVRGSDVNPCSHQGSFVDQDKQAFEICYDRCRPSVIAFSQKEAAAQFSGTHGGVVESYAALLGALSQPEGAAHH